MFQLKLNNKKGSKHHLARLYAQEATQIRKKQEKLINDWLEQESDFDSQNLISSWEQLRKDYGHKLTHETIKFMAISNSVLDVNNFLLRKMKMEGVSINTQDFYLFLEKMFNVNIANLVVCESGLPAKTQDDILTRVVARNFPNRENKQKEFIPALLPNDE